jgi:PhnB protein
MAHRELFAYLRVRRMDEAVAFYQAAFGATEKFRLVEPGGRVGHAELDLQGPTLMLSEEFPEYGILAPQPGAPDQLTLHLHVDDCDAVIEWAVAAGAVLQMPAADQFYGERSGSFHDPFGYRWNVGHQIEKLGPEEMQRRYIEMLKKA